ncbi:MAG TPA: CBS domain-containing protein [Bdellovibrionota bacterium]|jgi:acetoin utilization protein AcuB
MREVPTIDQFMTSMPHTINSGMPLKTAKEMMKKFGVRHLPVQVAGHLVGVLTERDLQLAMRFDKDNNFMVEDAMTPDPFSVHSTSRFDEVIATMIEHKYSCALVQDFKGKAVGIFTVIDALKVCGESVTGKRRPTRQRKGA